MFSNMSNKSYDGYLQLLIWSTYLCCHYKNVLYNHSINNVRVCLPSNHIIVKYQGVRGHKPLKKNLLLSLHHFLTVINASLPLEHSAKYYQAFAVTMRP